MRQILLCITALLCLTGCASETGETPTGETPPAASRSGLSAAPAGQSSQPAVDGSAVPGGITSEQAAAIGPLAPSEVSALVVAGGVRLSWRATGEDVTGYVCLRHRTGSEPWTVIGRTGADRTTLFDPQPAAGQYSYAVQAVSVNGRLSPMTESAAVVVR